MFDFGLTVKRILLSIIDLIKKKKDQWARNIFDMIYLPWTNQKVIKGRKNPQLGYVIGKMQKHLGFTIFLL
jgi:hypothetical protein